MSDPLSVIFKKNEKEHIRRKCTILINTLHTQYIDFNKNQKNKRECVFVTM
jgi:hypothetical protein